MNDRELLELAAKAAGMVIVSRCDDGRLGIEGLGRWWNPLTDDGDALRLVVKLHLTIDRSEIKPAAVVYCDWQDRPLVQTIEDHGNDPYTATRRAIVRAAAKIGKEMK